MHYSKMYGSSSSVHPLSVSRTRGASVDCPLTRQGQIGQGSICVLTGRASAIARPSLIRTRQRVCGKWR